MPTILTHAIVPLAVGGALGPKRISRPLLVTGIALAMLPDIDVVAFKFGIPYADQFGHRGASHSLFVAAAMAALLVVLLRPQNARLALAFLFASMASHGILDSFTNGGLGPALFWPFDSARHFAPVTPIRVSPIGASFFSVHGLETLLSEMLWVWLPAALILAGIGHASRTRSIRPDIHAQ